MNIKIMLQVPHVRVCPTCCSVKSFWQQRSLYCLECVNVIVFLSVMFLIFIMYGFHEYKSWCKMQYESTFKAFCTCWVDDHDVQRVSFHSGPGVFCLVIHCAFFHFVVVVVFLCFFFFGGGCRSLLSSDYEEIDWPSTSHLSSSFLHQ